MKPPFSTLRKRVSALSHLTIGTALVVILGLVVALATTGVVRNFISMRGAKDVYADFRTAAQLKAGDEVRVHGIQVGKVADIEVLPGGRVARAHLKVLPTAGATYRDARAAIRFRTVLGANFVVDLDQGSRRSGALDGSIPVSRTETQVEVDDITTAVNGGARHGLRTILRETPRGLANPLAPRAALRTLAAVSPDVRVAARALRGTSEGDMPALIRNAARVVKALDTPTDSMRSLVQGAGETLRATARRSSDIRQTLRMTPRVLTNASLTLTRLRHSLALADPLIASLNRPAPDIAPTVRVLRPTVVNADRLLGDAVPLLRSLRPTATDLAETARQGVPLLDALNPSLERLDRKVQPKLAEVDPVSKRPTYEMIGPTFAGLTGASGQFDAEGHWFRFPASGGTNTFNSQPCREFLTDPQAPRLADCDALLKTLVGIFGQPSPTPKPKP